MRWIKRLILWPIVLFVVIVLLLPIGLVALFRYVPPPITMVMAADWLSEREITRQWVPLAAISPHLRHAAIAAEDNKFCDHGGFDLDAIKEAIEDYQGTGRLRGASTITMQTAKNLFLWHGRDWPRKALEAYYTLIIEQLWDKRRIIEVYLNIAEWGPGLYGAEAASRAHFRKAAAALTPREASLLAAVLPNPREWSPARPSSRVSSRAQRIAARIGQLGPRLRCVQ